MHSIWIIAKRELRSFFDSLIAYIILVLFLGFSGFFTWLYGSDIFLIDQATLTPFFNIAFWTLFFFIPALTMRLIAEEKKTGTIELLLTKAVSDRQVIVGKFLSAFILVVTALLFTTPYIITIYNIGKPDIGQICCGYAGLLLMSGVYISIGLYASSITSNQIVAFLIALSIGLLFHILFDVLSENLPGVPAEIAAGLSLSNHFESISRGVLDTRDLIYFLSIIIVGIFLSELSLTKRNIQQVKTELKQKLFISASLIIGIIIVINLLSNEFHLRIDFTRDRQYTLSEATTNIIANLSEPVTIKAYYSEGLPPYVMKARKDLQELLIEYANASDGNVMYEFINPAEDEKHEKEAVNYGIRPILIDIREKDQVKQQKAFLGAVVLLGEKKEPIGVLQPGAAMEYGLTTAIRKISMSDKPSIGFLQGHGEPGLQELIELNEQLGIQYKTEPVFLSDSILIDPEIKTLAVIRPLDSIPQSHLQRLDDFITRGGRLLVAINTVDGDLRSLSGYPLTTGLESWLLKSGVLVDLSFVIDASCGSVMVPQQLGQYTLETKVSFPYIPIIKTFNEHAVTTGLEALMFQFASTIQFIGDSTITFTPLALTSERSNALRAPQQFDIQKQWSKSDFPLKNLVVAAAIEKKGQHSKIIVVSDGDFVINGPPQQARRLQADNLSFFSNAVDWLSDDTGLVSLRTKSVTSYPLDEFDDNMKAILKYTNFCLPLMLVIGYGIFRSQRNRIKRLKRMSENYEKI